jgi:shikimate kinase
MTPEPVSNRQRIFLLGFMGAGKTTIGHRVAGRLGWTFTDLDETIIARQQRSISQIFADEGEAAFRLHERAALEAVLAATAERPAVIALGGGTIAQPENHKLVQDANGVTVWLDCQLEELEHRCEGQNGRPLFQNPAQFQELYRQRRPYYEQADFRVDSSALDPTNVVEEILQCLQT